MKAYICDRCGKQGEPNKTYDWPPDGWYHVYGTIGTPQKHVCGIGCLRAYADQEEARLTPEAPPPPAPVMAEEIVNG